MTNKRVDSLKMRLPLCLPPTLSYQCFYPYKILFSLALSMVNGGFIDAT